MKLKRKNIRPRIMLPRNLMVTQVVTNKRGRGAYDRAAFKKGVLRD
jgi:hypothetical protein